MMRSHKVAGLHPAAYGDGLPARCGRKRQPAYARLFRPDLALTRGARLWYCGSQALQSAGMEVGAGHRTTLALVNEHPAEVDWSLLSGCDVLAIQREEPLYWQPIELLSTLLAAGAGTVAIVHYRAGFVQDLEGRALFAGRKSV